MGMELEQEKRECAFALAKAVETAAANGLSAGGGARLREILDRHWISDIDTICRFTVCSLLLCLTPRS